MHLQRLAAVNRTAGVQGQAVKMEDGLHPSLLCSIGVLQAHGFTSSLAEILCRNENNPFLFPLCYIFFFVI